ncbi:zf-HC2 domain-containing protein [Modicisalibacter ilicicola]|nr:zf-HC2 domain-containing protein [Halomonas ilicicola]
MMICKEITKLMSRRLDTSLTLQERLALHMHIAMCGACRECNKQFELLHLTGHEYQNLILDTDTASGSSDTPEA